MEDILGHDELRPQLPPSTSTGLMTIDTCYTMQLAAYVCMQQEGVWLYIIVSWNEVQPCMHGDTEFNLDAA